MGMKAFLSIIDLLSIIKGMVYTQKIFKIQIMHNHYPVRKCALFILDIFECF